MQTTFPLKARTFGAGVAHALAPFATRQLFCGAGVACVLGLGLGAWMKPPSVEVTHEPMQPVMMAAQDDSGGWAQTAPSGYWQMRSENTGSWAEVSPAAGDFGPDPQTPDVQTAQSSIAWRVAEADTTPPAALADVAPDASPAAAPADAAPAPPTPQPPSP